jgi:hypothetical protein
MRYLVALLMVCVFTLKAQYYKTNGPILGISISEDGNEIVRIRQGAYRDTGLPNNQRGYIVTWDIGADSNIDWLEAASDWPIFVASTNLGAATPLYLRQNRPVHPLGPHTVEGVWGYRWGVSDIFVQPRTNIYFISGVERIIPEEFFLGVRVHRADGPHYGWVHVRRPATNAVDPEVMILAAAVHPAPNAPVRTGVIPPQPVVNTTVDGGAVVFTWHADYATFRLETTASLDDPVTWLPVDTGGAVRHVLTLGTGNQFFRLVPP